MTGRRADLLIHSVPLTAAVDAKDVFDKSNSDTPGFGSQKSLAFSIAWMRSVLRLPNTALKWTSTENMWIDGGTKDMDLSHMRSIMSLGRWSISYSPEFVKQVAKAKKLKPLGVASACADLPGVRVDGGDPLLGHLMKIGERRGWHLISGIGIQLLSMPARSEHQNPDFPLPRCRFEVAMQDSIWTTPSVNGAVWKRP